MGRVRSVNCWRSFDWLNGRLECSKCHEKYWKCCKFCKGLLGRRSQKCSRKMQFCALHGFRLEPIRSSETRGRLSEQASVCEGHSQKPVPLIEQWVSSSEQVSGCGRSSELCGGSSKRSFGCVRSSGLIFALANLMLPAVWIWKRKRSFDGRFRRMKNQNTFKNF